MIGITQRGALRPRAYLHFARKAPWSALWNMNDRSSRGSVRQVPAYVSFLLCCLSGAIEQTRPFSRATEPRNVRRPLQAVHEHDADYFGRSPLDIQGHVPSLGLIFSKSSCPLTTPHPNVPSAACQWPQQDDALGLLALLGQPIHLTPPAATRRTSSRLLTKVKPPGHSYTQTTRESQAFVSTSTRISLAPFYLVRLHIRALDATRQQ